MRTPARRLYGYLFTLDNEPLAGPVEGDGTDDLRFEMTGRAVTLIMRDTKEPAGIGDGPHVLLRLLILEKDRLPSWTMQRLNLGTRPPAMDERDIFRASIQLPDGVVLP
jgi:hypothetical protein